MRYRADILKAPRNARGAGVLAGVALLICGSGLAVAQMEGPSPQPPIENFAAPTGFGPQVPLGMTDVYGNAQFDLPDRRPLGIYSSEAEWGSLGALSTFNRHTDQRGGLIAFALPGELLGLSTMRSLADSASPFMLADVSPHQRRALLEYGGFGDRMSGTGDALADAFARRFRLIDASSNYSPVYRALMQNRTLSGVRPVASVSPSGSVESLTPNLPDSIEHSTSLYELLKSDVDTNHERSRTRAWELFEEKEFQQAARTFKSVLVLDRDDMEARIGEFFCYVVIGSTATAAVLIERISGLEANPFLVDVGVRDRFRDEGWVQQLMIDSRLRLGSDEASSNPHLTAAYTFILWHLGDRESALRAAESLTGNPLSAVYAGWPAKMRAARAVTGSGR